MRRNDTRIIAQTLARAFCAVTLVLGVVACRTVALEEFPAPDGPQELRVVSWNVHFDDATDSLEEREDRVRGVCVVADGLGADILCLQEVTTTREWQVLEQSLLESELRRMLTGYEWVVPRGAAELSTSNPILYRRDRFLPIRQGVEWYSNTPGVPDSAHWGNIMPRYAVWALFYDHATRRHLLVINTHLDHRSRAANRRAVEALLALVDRESSGKPVIVAGDFNNLRFGTVQSALSNRFTRVLGPLDPPTFSGIPLMQIDEIFVSADVTVLNRAVIDLSSHGRTSDHRPVLAVLALQGRD